MVQTAMYILLGVLVTLLAMLVVMPMIWRRAVRLTKKRILGEMSISFNEVQAEKDMVRAELAIEQRRLEVTVEEQQNNLTANSFKIDRLSKTITEREQTIDERDQSIDGLNEKLADQQQAYANQADILKLTDETLSSAKDSIADLETIKAGLEQDLIHLETSHSEQKVEIVAQMARIEGLREEISNLQQQRKQEMNLRSEAEGKLSQRTTEFDRNKERLEKSEEKIDALQAELADKDSQIDTLNQRLDRMKNNAQTSEETDNTARLAEAEARRVEAETKIAGLTLQLENQQLVNEAGDNIEGVIADLQQQKQQLSDQLAATEQKTQSLGEELETLRKEKGIFSQDSVLSPNEHQLRNEIRNIAARMVDHVASQEGQDSPISDILAKKNGKSLTENIQEEITQKDDPFSHVVSLADRIKAASHESQEDEKHG